MFLRWSGVVGRETEGDDGAKVGELSMLEDGSIVGSKSRSGRGGERSGRRVILRSRRRKAALVDM